MAASVCVILAILAALGLVWRLGAIFMLLGVSAFLAVVLNPLVEAVARRFHLPKRLRYCLLHAAARLTRSGRRTYLRIQANWPWVNHLARAFDRLGSMVFRT